MTDKTTEQTNLSESERTDRSEHSLHHNDVVYSHWEISVEQQEWHGATLNEVVTSLRQWHAEQAKR